MNSLSPPPPAIQGFTIYTIENCKFCEKAKATLENPTIIDCNPYLSFNENKELFFTAMKSLTNNSSHKTFPYVFYNADFIGGYTELVELIKMLD